MILLVLILRYIYTSIIHARYVVLLHNSSAYNCSQPNFNSADKYVRVLLRCLTYCCSVVLPLLALTLTCSVVVCRYDRNEDTSDLDAVTQGYCLYQYESTSGTVVEANLTAIALIYCVP